MSRVFKDTVIRIVKGIPRGSVLSYAAVAAKAGHPGASRAVGSIMKANYDPSVPCHRVIRSDGTLGDYNRGKEKKIELLRKEGVVFE